MNASINTAASAIAAQPLPSAGVSKFFALKQRLFINGEWVEARSGRTVQVFDPATGRQIGLVADAGPVGGEAPSHPGYFVKPTVLVNVNQDMRVVREEIFGPVLVAQRFDDLDDVVKAANDTTYGLGASIWTNNLTAAHRLIPRIKAGTVWVNCHNLVDPNMPFGGYKQSGFGREHGRVAVEMYTETKSVCIML